MRNFTLLLVVFSLLLLAPPLARADAISPPPTTCVAGSMGVLCHGPPRCAPETCAGDGDCATGQHCGPQPLCIDTVSCGGLTTTMDPNVVGTCLTGHCAAGGTCMTEMVCLPSSAPVDDPIPLDGPAAMDAPASDALTMDAPTTDAPARDAPAASDALASDAPPMIDAGATRSAGGCCALAGASGAPGSGAVLTALAALAWARRRLTQRRS